MPAKHGGGWRLGGLFQCPRAACIGASQSPTEKLPGNWDTTGDAGGKARNAARERPRAPAFSYTADKGTVVLAKGWEFTQEAYSVSSGWSKGQTKQQQGPFSPLGCHSQQKTKGNPNSNLSDPPFAITSQLPSPLLRWEQRGQPCWLRRGTADRAAPATGLHQDKFTSPETQQLGARGEAAGRGEISGLSSFWFVFFPLCPGRLRVCRAPDYTLPGAAGSRGSQTIPQPAR